MQLKTNFPRVEVKARISTDLHRRMLEECGQCGCHINSFIAIAIAHEVANRKRKRDSDAHLDNIVNDVLGGNNNNA